MFIVYTFFQVSHICPAEGNKIYLTFLQTVDPDQLASAEAN